MNDIKDFFLTDNKSGYKTNEKWLKNNKNELYLSIMNNSLNSNIPFIEKVFLYINDLKDVPRCPTCNKYVKFIGTLRHGYSKYCSIGCLNKSDEHKNKTRITSIKYFGINNPMKDDNIKNKQIATLIKNYGVNNPMKIKSVIDDRNRNIEIGEEFNIKRMLNRINDNTITYIKHDLVENDNVNFHCSNCGNDFKINSNLLTSRISNNTTICTVCNKNKSFSKIQKSLEDFITSLGVNYESKNRTILNGMEIDTYLLDNKLGIEIDGLFWHSNKFKNKNYHLNKTEECEKQGIQLLHIFEDEWLHKKEIVKSIIKSKLGIFDNKIFACDCILKEIDKITCSNFLENNHIEGVTKSKIRVGLFHNAELISVMTFKRKNNINCEYEMNRFGDKLNTQIIDGASKLLNYFIETYQPKSILAIVDRRYNQGNQYKQLGFTFVENTKPNYFYYNSRNSENKKLCKKDMLSKQKFNTNEKEIKFLKIYDSGNMKFIYSRT